MPAVETKPMALQKLIQRRLKELRLSYGEAAKKGEMPKATMANLATQPLRQVPRPSTLVALSTALDLPLSTIQETVAECVGLVYVVPNAGRGSSRTTRALIDTVCLLNRENQQTIVKLAESLLQSEQAANNVSRLVPKR